MLAETFVEQVAEWVRRRKALGWNARTLSVRAGIFHASLSRIENGKTKSCTWYLARQIERALAKGEAEMLDRLTDGRRITETIWAYVPEEG